MVFLMQCLLCKYSCLKGNFELLLKFFLAGIHPTIISESFQKAAVKAIEFISGMSTPVDLSDRESLLKSATTSLNSKVSSFSFFEMYKNIF